MLDHAELGFQERMLFSSVPPSLLCMVPDVLGESWPDARTEVWEKIDSHEFLQLRCWSVSVGVPDEEPREQEGL